MIGKTRVPMKGLNNILNIHFAKTLINLMLMPFCLSRVSAVININDGVYLVFHCILNIEWLVRRTSRRISKEKEKPIIGRNMFLPFDSHHWRINDQQPNEAPL